MRDVIVYCEVPKDELHPGKDVFEHRESDKHFVKMKKTLIKDIRLNGLNNPLCCKHSKTFKVTIGKQRLNAILSIDSITHPLHCM